jgi:hypothetical protein
MSLRKRQKVSENKSVSGPIIDGNQSSSNNHNKLDHETATIPSVIILDGESLTIEQLMSLENEQSSVRLSDASWKRIDQARAVVDKIVNNNERVYGMIVFLC